MKLFAIPLGILFTGSLVYSGLTAAAALLHRQRPKMMLPMRANARPISVLKPLFGVDDGLRQNLESFFQQNYPAFELVFAVRYETDPATGIVRSLQRSYPQIPVQLLTTGEPPFANAKVHSLDRMTKAAAHEWLVMSDSDIRVPPDFLMRVAGELCADGYDLATCPYQAVPGGGIWSLLEALGMNSEFWPGVLAAKLLEGVKFTVGPTIVARKNVFETVRWDSLSQFLAEDFVLGQRAAEAGIRVDLSACTVEHRLSRESAWQNLSHRLRWARSSRRSRPAGYVGQIFTFPTALGVLLCFANHAIVGPVLLTTVLFRLLAIHSVEAWVLKTDLCSRYFYLVPIQDILGFLVWTFGFFGKQIHWRGRRYLLNRDGTFQLVSGAT